MESFLNKMKMVFQHYNLKFYTVPSTHVQHNYAELGTILGDFNQNRVD